MPPPTVTKSSGKYPVLLVYSSISLGKNPYPDTAYTTGVVAETERQTEQGKIRLGRVEVDRMMCPHLQRRRPQLYNAACCFLMAALDGFALLVRETAAARPRLPSLVTLRVRSRTERMRVAEGQLRTARESLSIPDGSTEQPV